MLQSEMPDVQRRRRRWRLAVHACRDFKRHQNRWSGDLVRIEARTAGRLWLLYGFHRACCRTRRRSGCRCSRSARARYADRTPRRSFVDRPTSLLGMLDGRAAAARPRLRQAGHVDARCAYGCWRRRARSSDTTCWLTARASSALGRRGLPLPGGGCSNCLRPAAGRRSATIRLDERAGDDCLATVRTMHFDAVDLFLQCQVGAPDSFRRRIDAAADVELVRRQIHMVGFFNNAVHLHAALPEDAPPAGDGRAEASRGREGPAAVHRRLHDRRRADVPRVGVSAS